MAMPPQSLQNEQALLGSLFLAEPSELQELLPLLGPDDFYARQHGLMYAAILGLWRAGQPCDFLTVSDALDQAGHLEAVGGRNHVMELAAAAATSVNAPAYAGFIRRDSLRREGIRRAQLLQQHLYESDDLDAAAVLAAQIPPLLSQHHSSRPRILGSVATETLQARRAAREAERSLGITSGFRTLDAKLVNRGFTAGQLVLVGARPGMGKTALLTHMAARSAAAGHPWYIASAEMTAEAIALRAVAAEAKQSLSDLHEFRMGAPEATHALQAAEWMQTLPLYISDDHLLTVGDVQAAAIKARRMQGGRLDAVAVDYLQLLRHPGSRQQSRQEEVAAVSGALKRLAKDLQVAVIAATAVNRRSEEHREGKPTLADLRESGAPEFDADLVLLQWRASYYDAEAADDKTLTILIAKQRDGPTGEIQLFFDRTQSRFADLDTTHVAAPPSKPAKTTRRGWIQ